MKYTVLGTGAIGGYYGGMLRKSGLPVDFLARSDYQYIKEHGLMIDSIKGDFILRELDVYDSVENLPDTDVVIVSMKTTANENLSELLLPIVKEGTVIFVLQNGLGMEEELQKQFPHAVVIGGMCFICSQKRGPGYIVHLDKGPITAAPLHESDFPIAEKLRSDFVQAGIEMTLSRNLKHARWGKLLWNIPFNGLSVVLNANTKEIMDNPYGLSLAQRLMEEVSRGASACGCNLPSGSIAGMLESTQTMAPYDPSMKLDYDHRRPMEVEYMYRKPLQEARKNGADLPLVAALADQLSFLNQMVEVSV